MSAGRFLRRHTRCVAMQVTADNVADVAAWVNGHCWAAAVVVPTMRVINGQRRTGETLAPIGDWVLKLPDSRWQVVDDDTFRVEWMVAR